VLIVETIAKVRRKYFVDGVSIKRISLDLRLSRNTVRKIVRSGKTEHQYHRINQPVPQLGKYLERLHQMLKEDSAEPKKSRRTAMKLFETLRAEGYSGAYDSVQRCVRKWEEEERSNPPQVFIPLSFSPGDAYQFDWSYEIVTLGGAVQTVKVAQIRLCHSRMFFVAAYPRETLEMVIDAHNRAFAWFGGTCRRGIYDNMPTAVDDILKGKDRNFNRRFARMCSHYLVEPVACTPAAGWEKGQVEKQVQDIRHWLFAPRPSFENFDELNRWLAERCREICSTRMHPEDKEKTILEVFEKEKSSLMAVKSAFDGYTETGCRASSTSLVRYDKNQYSVDCRSARKAVTIRATADRIRVFGKNGLIADHKRMFGKHKTIYDPWHYVDALERKPGALRNGAPFKDWELPPAVQQIQARLLGQKGGDREFVEILSAASAYGLPPIEQACIKALAQGTVQSSVILNLIVRELDPPKAETVTVSDRLRLKEEPVADCSRYDLIRREVQHAAV